MGRGAKIALIIIGVLILGLGGLAAYVALQPEAPQTVEAVPPSALETQSVETPGPTAAGEPDISPEPELTPGQTPEPEDTLPDGIYNILVIGTDSRTADDTEATGASDSVMVLSFNTNTNTVTMISIMRDSVIARIGENASYPSKLNEAYSRNGGAKELIDTINLNFELNIADTDYIAMGFEGFARLIDRIGGLDVSVTDDEAYVMNWRCAGLGQADNKRNRKSLLQSQGLPVLEEDHDGHPYEGLKVQHLTGMQALWYARERHAPFVMSQTGGDHGRIERQQYLMQLIYKKVKEKKDIPTVIALIDFALKHVKTKMTAGTMLKLGNRLLNADDITFVNVYVPFFDSSVPFKENPRYGIGSSACGGKKVFNDPGSCLYFDVETTAACLYRIIYLGESVETAQNQTFFSRN